MKLILSVIGVALFVGLVALSMTMMVIMTQAEHEWGVLLTVAIVTGIIIAIIIGGVEGAFYISEWRKKRKDQK